MYSWNMSKDALILSRTHTVILFTSKKRSNYVWTKASTIKKGLKGKGLLLPTKFQELVSWNILPMW